MIKLSNMKDQNRSTKGPITWAQNGSTKEQEPITRAQNGSATEPITWAQNWSAPEPPPAQAAISGLDYEGLQKCVHCGFCMQACPTYRQTGLEMASPRGRLALMRAVAEGKLPVDEGFADPMALCLGCRACETACPSGVPYGRLLEESRSLAAAVVPAPWPVRFALDHLLAYPRRLRVLAFMARLGQRLGLHRMLPPALREAAAALPPTPVRVPQQGSGSEQSQVTTDPHAPHPGVSPEQAAGHFFLGCVQEAFLPHQNQAALRVLAAAGTPCSAADGQSCCGALHAHSGDMEGAKSLAQQNIAFFEQWSGPIINHAGGCGAHLKEYGHLLRDDPRWAERARTFSGRVKDLSEWLNEVGLPQDAFGELDLTVTYQDSCHLAHGQKVRAQPRAVLRSIPGLRLQEMEAADQCCGSAGIYNFLQPQMASRVLAEKMGHVSATAATVLVTANPGCYMQLCQGIRRHGLADRIEVLSVAEVLDRALQSGRR